MKTTTTGCTMILLLSVVEGLSAALAAQHADARVREDGILCVQTEDRGNEGHAVIVWYLNGSNPSWTVRRCTVPVARFEGLASAV